MVREGADVSIITYGAVVHRAEVAAAELERQGVSVESSISVRYRLLTGRPIAATVRKTNRVIVAYEDTLSWGYEPKSPRASATSFSITWTPRCGALRAMDTFCAYHPNLEDEILPQTRDLVAAVQRVAGLLTCPGTSLCTVPGYPCQATSRLIAFHGKSREDDPDL